MLGRDESGQMSVEYALAAALFVALAAAAIAIFPAAALNRWVEAVGDVMLVKVSDPRDVAEIIRELTER